MKFLLFICLLGIILLIYNLNKSYKKNLFFTIILSALIIYIILNPKASITFTIDGAKLFFYSVFPSLFPFLVIVNLIFAFGGIDIYSRLFGNILCKPLRLPKECSVVLLASTFCGYPLGARYASELYEMDKIDKLTFERLLNIATNGSPLFIVGTVGTTMLHSPILGYTLLISNILSCIVMGLLLPSKPYKKNHSASQSIANSQVDVNFGVALKCSLEDATKTCISIGSFVIIFSLIINMIKSSNIYITALRTLCSHTGIPYNLVDGILLGFLEITNGCNIISISTLGIDIKVILCSFLIGFSGLSITSQVYSFIYKYKVSMKKYLFLKALQGLLCALIIFIIIKLPLSIFNKDVFFSNTHTTSFKTSYVLLLAFFLILPVLIENLIKLFNSHQAP